MMKAESCIFTGAHLPMTIFGLPPTMFVLPIALAAVSFSFTVIVGLVPLGLPVSTAIFIWSYAYCFRRVRKDHHAATYLIIAPRIWRKRQTRTFLAGVPSDQKRNKP